MTCESHLLNGIENSPTNSSRPRQRITTCVSYISALRCLCLGRMLHAKTAALVCRAKSAVRDRSYLCLQLVSAGKIGILNGNFHLGIDQHKQIQDLLTLLLTQKERRNLHTKY